MAKIEQIIKKLNINSVDFAGAGQASDDTELRIQDIFAALGFGDLPVETTYIGLAVMRRDAVDIKMANVFAARISEQAFKQYEWSAAKPYHSMVKAMVNKGIIQEEDVDRRKELLGRQLIFNLGKMALYEQTGPHSKRCPMCEGTGIHKGYRCRRCHGNTRVVHVLNERKRSQRSRIRYDAWMKTWRNRYQIIQGRIQWNVGEFSEHLKRKC